MSNRAVIEAFWNARTKSDGYTKCHGWVKGEIRDKVIKENNIVHYLLWDNEIARLVGNTLTLSDCGWQTNTTQDRLNAILKRVNTVKGEFFIQKERHVWYLRYREWDEKEEKFINSQSFKWGKETVFDLKNPFKRLKPFDTEAIDKKAKEMKKTVDKFVREMKIRVEKGELQTGGGECWGVLMGLSECHECQYLASPICGGGAHLILKALTEKKYLHPAIFMCKQDEKGNVVPDNETILNNWDTIKKALSDFIRKSLIKKGAR